MPGMSALGMLGISAIFGNRGGLVVAGVYGTIYVAEGTTAQGSIGTTFQKMTGFVANGPSQGMTPDHADDSIQVDVAGDYLILCQISFSGTANAEFHAHIYINGVQQPHGFHRKLSGADVGSASIMCILGLSVGDKITIGIGSDDGANSESFTPEDAQLLAAKCG